MSVPLSLLDVLAQVPDPRSRGRRHPLTAILSLAVLAMLSGAQSYQALSQFGRDKGFALAHALGFTRGKTLTKSTFSVLFRMLDVQAFEDALSRWIASRLPQGQERPISLDGKTARRRLTRSAGAGRPIPRGRRSRLCWRHRQRRGGRAAFREGDCGEVRAAGDAQVNWGRDGGTGFNDAGRQSKLSE